MALAIPKLSGTGANYQDTLDELSARYKFAMVGGVPVIVDTDSNDTLLTVESFKKKLLNSYVKFSDAKGNEIKQNAADAWLRWEDRDTYDNFAFRPETDERVIKETGRLILNRWRGFAVEPVQGSWNQLKDLWFTIADSKEAFLYQFGWFAWSFQRREVRDKLGVNLILRGDEGCGKNTIIDAIGHLWGKHFLPLKTASELTGGFNGHLETAMLVHCEESLWRVNRDDDGPLKALITGKEILINPKYIAAYKAPAHFAIVTSSNHDWVVPASLKARRYAMFDCQQHSRMGHKSPANTRYWKAIQDELDNGGYSALLYDLLSFDFDRFGVNPYAVPETSALAQQKEATLAIQRPVEAWLLEAAQTGTIRMPSGDSFNVDAGRKLYKNDALEAANSWCQKRRVPVQNPTTLGKALHEALGATLVDKRDSVGRYYILPSADVISSRIRSRLGLPDSDAETENSDESSIESEYPTDTDE